MKDFKTHCEQVIINLTAAFEHLQKPVMNNPEGGFSESFNEYISHNELELALDELEGLAEVNTVDDDFWRAMIKASKLMDLTEHKNRYEGKLTNGR